MKAPRKLQLLCFALAVASLSSAAPPQNQPSDEAALGSLIIRYYTAYSKKDLGALVTFWSQRSPDLRAGIQEALQAMEKGVYSASDVAVSQIKIAGNKAILQASSDLVTLHCGLSVIGHRPLDDRFAFGNRIDIGTTSKLARRLDAASTGFQG